MSGLEMIDEALKSFQVFKFFPEAALLLSSFQYPSIHLCLEMALHSHYRRLF